MPIVKICFPFKKQYFDKKAVAEGFLLCGVDEVGRGCLAGPVVTAALILKPASMRTKSRMPQLADSKILTPEERQKAYDWLIHNSWFATASIHHRTIDKVNIYQATLKAMRRAIIQMRLAYPSLQVPAAIVVDAMPLDASFLWETHDASRIVLKKDHPDAQKTMEQPWGNVLYFNYGEERSKAIAAASIIAKVTRDRIMHNLSPSFPAYTFASHKGYAVPAHKEYVTLCGRSLIHRVSFRSEYDLPDEKTLQAGIDFTTQEQIVTEEIQPF